MTFLAAGFLAAALAAVIPVVLHLIHRQRAKVVPFPTLRFVRISVQRTRRKRRIHDLLLLLLRVLALLLIALGLAEPTVTAVQGFWGEGSAAVAIILDNSASMGSLDQGHPRLDVAKAAAVRILDQLGLGDHVALLPTNGPPFAEQGKLHSSQEVVRSILSEVDVSYEQADLASAIARAREVLLESESASRQIFVITDMQERSWDGMGPPDDGRASSSDAGPSGPSTDRQVDRAASSIPVVVLNCASQAEPNVALTSIEVQTTVPVAGVPVQVTTEIVNASSTPQTRHVQLHVDGRRRYASPALQLEPDQRIKHEMPFSLEGGGTHQGEVRLVGEDGRDQDNRRFFTVEVNQGIPVAIVRADDHEIPHLGDAYYVEKALAPGQAGAWVLRPTLLRADQLLSEPLSTFTAIFCVNLPAPDPATAERLRAYVRQGGNLVWIAGDRMDPQTYNALNDAGEVPLLPAPLGDLRRAEDEAERDSWHIASIDKSHPALDGLAEPPSLYQSVLVYAFVDTQVDEEAGTGVRVLARLDNGRPLLLFREIGAGSVTFWATGAHVRWTNFPIRPIFLPLLIRYTCELAGMQHTQQGTLAGMPLVVPIEGGSAAAVEIIPPSGETIRREVDAEQSEREAFQIRDTHQIGVYRFRPMGTSLGREIAMAVNPDPAEVEPARIDQSQLETRFGQTTPLVYVDGLDRLDEAFRDLRQGRSLWGGFLLAVLVVLVFETLVSNRLSPTDSAAVGLEPDAPRARVRTTDAAGGR